MILPTTTVKNLEFSGVGTVKGGNLKTDFTYFKDRNLNLQSNDI